VIALHLIFLILYFFFILQRELSFMKKLSKFGVYLPITSKATSYSFFLQIPWYTFLYIYNGLHENVEHYASITCFIILILIWSYSMFVIPMKKKEALDGLRVLKREVQT